MDRVMKNNVSALALCVPLAVIGGAAFSETATPWDLLAAIQIDEIMTDTTYEVRKVFPAAIENGIESFDISGFVVPLTDGNEISDFILVSDMGFCPFCGSPEHGTSLQVSLASPVAGLIEGSRVSLRGSLEAITDPETFQSAIMRNAQIVDG
ncbi:MAG: hypothetical protein ACI86S_002358 [Paracoccaceae bacterium]|jgi:hypothetical protein